MDYSKKRSKNFGLTETLIYGLLLFLPFGQLLVYRVPLIQRSVAISVYDVFAICILLTSVRLRKLQKAEKRIYFLLLIIGFSLLLSYFQLQLLDFITGSLYFIRFVLYVYLFIASFRVFTDKTSRYRLLSFILISIIAAAILGWLQYIYLSDLRSMKFIGWDDHLDRLAGTFFDPGYSAIIYTIGGLISLWMYHRKNNYYFIVIFIFLAITILLTYSRSSYLALMFGMGSLLLKQKIKRRVISFLILFFIAGILFLPGGQGEGVNLKRTSTIIARSSFLEESVEIAKINPLFGVGFNNICTYRVSLFPNTDPTSHSCAGSDQSLLYIFMTSGIIGLIAFVSMMHFAYTNSISEYKALILSIYSALFINSLFINSLFYPFIMGLLMLSLGGLQQPILKVRK